MIASGRAAWCAAVFALALARAAYGAQTPAQPPGASPSPSPSAPPTAASAQPSIRPLFSGPVPALPPAAPVPAWTLAPGAVRPHDGGGAWDAPRVAALRRDLATLFDSPVLHGAHAGFSAVDARDGRTLFDRDGDAILQAASTFKLLVGSVALERLGPAFRFRTAAYLVPPSGESPASRVRGGWTAAALVLRGGGDPFLATADLDDFASAVARSGVQYVGGGFFINVSHFDRAPYPAGWTWDDFLEDYAVKISALALDENVFYVFVESGGRAGAPAILHARALPLVPQDAARAGCAPFPESLASVVPPTLAPGARDTLDVARGPEGCVIFSGGIPADSNGESFAIAVPDPERYAYRVALARLAARGVEIDAGANAPAESPPFDRVADPRGDARAEEVWAHESPPLAAMLPRFWIPSDNLVGENLLEEIGVAAGGEAAAHESALERSGFVVPGRSPARERAFAYEKLWLRSIGQDTPGIEIADGCGMSQYDRISPRALVAILQHDWNGLHRELILDALPVGGARGDIPGIAAGSELAGRVWAKTGSMMHVRGLAGYVATKDRGTVTFAFNVDDFTGDYEALSALRARVLARIASE